MINQADHFDLGTDEILPPYVDADGVRYRSLEKLVDAGMRYFYSRPGLDGRERKQWSTYADGVYRNREDK